MTIAATTPSARRYDLRKATDRALRHVQVSGALACEPAAFAAALRTGDGPDTVMAAVRLFLEEGEAHAMAAIVAEGSSDFATLATLAHALLPPDHPTRRFLDEPPA